MPAKKLLPGEQNTTSMNRKKFRIALDIACWQKRVTEVNEEASKLYNLKA